MGENEARVAELIAELRRRVADGRESPVTFGHDVWPIILDSTLATEIADELEARTPAPHFGDIIDQQAATIKALLREVERVSGQLRQLQQAVDGTCRRCNGSGVMVALGSVLPCGCRR